MSSSEPAPWPYQQLDLRRLHETGWKPSPFQTFVLKVHQRCNLACDYCYVYSMPDQSWRERPAVMPPAILLDTATRIADHAASHGLTAIQLVLHGGEPLLAGAATILETTRRVRGALPAGTTAHVAIQTNGTLLDETMLKTLASDGIQIGVSLDGPEPTNDKHRLRASGRGSYTTVDRTLHLLGSEAYRHAFAGILAVIDPSSDPVECYEHLLRYNPPAVDFLLPHANWSAPHPASKQAEHPFGSWLVSLFDRWYDAPRQETRIRFFEEIIHTILGCTDHNGELGLAPVTVVVIETDGAIEQVDTLKSAYPGAAATGLSITRDPLDAALSHPGFVARQIGDKALCGTCQACELHLICGGGSYPHRFWAGAGFRNQSVYCGDLHKVITHVRQRVHSDLRPAQRLATVISSPEMIANPNL